uniref:Uncharacterized protein n=1 Tax=Myoviridae sp. ct0e511 TaxID=2825013 RepID=A0A8S5QKB6_9CAUD|nr:MAG TPA: hypothetical protein [Myoviridae sp. ct0e511]
MALLGDCKKKICKVLHSFCPCSRKDENLQHQTSRGRADGQLVRFIPSRSRVRVPPPLQWYFLGKTIVSVAGGGDVMNDAGRPLF